MKRKLTIAVIALAVAVGSTGVSLAETKGSVSLKSCFADIYKIFSFIIGGSGWNDDDSSEETGPGNGAADSDQDNGTENETPGLPDFGGGENFGGGTQDGGWSQGSGESYVQANKVLNLVNQERTKAGLSRLTLNSKLSSVAQMKAEDMAKNRYFSHNSPTYGSAFDMMKDYGISYMTAGENIAKGQKSAEAVMNAWMNSQGHRANILRDRYTELGVGYAVDENGTTYWVQMFIG